MTGNNLRALPAVDKLISSAAGNALIERYGRDSTLIALRATLDGLRIKIRAGETISPEIEAITRLVEQRLAADYRPTLRGVINATGIIIHTNLGRAPLSLAAQQALLESAAGYSTLEFDLETGKRGSRLIHTEKLLCDVTGAEAALVVNNAASALVLLLSELAHEREVIISRGQLIEIGGSFRIPDIMVQGGARLVEVGTTNRTKPSDYARAVTTETALLLHVHASNFQQIGFVESTALHEMADIAHQHNLYLIDDVGSGALLDTAPHGLAHEPTVQESLHAGSDLVVFSGDKLLGGPQAGIIAGKKMLIERLKRHPLARAVRADKLCLAALVATLDHYRRGEAVNQIPVWQMIAHPYDAIRAIAERWAAALGRDGVNRASVIDGESAVGGGSLPGATLRTALLALSVDEPDTFMAQLRASVPPVIARIDQNRVVFDPRTVLPAQEIVLMTIIENLL